MKKIGNIEGTTFLDRARGQRPTAEPAGLPLDRAIERLREGLAWFNEIWQSREAVSEDRWADMLDRWIVLEDVTRRLYDWSGCPQDPERCDPSGPFVCQACTPGGEDLVGGAAGQRVAQPVLFQTSGRH